MKTKKSKPAQDATVKKLSILNGLRVNYPIRMMKILPKNYGAGLITEKYDVTSVWEKVK